jgi:hypothetical protein
MGFMDHSSVLVGRSLLYFMSDDLLILEYDLARHSMAVLHPPGYRRGNVGRFNIMLTEDGGLDTLIRISDCGRGRRVTALVHGGC